MCARLAWISAHRGDHVAVEASDGSLTYAQLLARTHRLAHQLQSMGVGPGHRVGVSMPRGARELVSLLAILTLGAAYVPLDPTHPVERRSLIIDDAAPQLVLVGESSPLASGPAPTLVMPALAAVGEGFDATPPPASPGPRDLAYVMFTSGSTGRPKGVQITRGALANFLGSMAHTPGLRSDDRLLAVTTTAFDIAGLELYLPLWVGGTVVIADAAVARDPGRLRVRLEAGDITVMQATPATWRLLLEAGWSGAGSLRMLCGGEALPPALADRLLATGGELWNMYGPTETTIWSSVQRIELGYDRVTIGRPIDHTTMMVVDQAMQPRPAGQEGELVIGGRGLARGYRGRPELTAARFVEGPDGRRLYRTGDLARELPDGRFECIGRLDHQVKIEGYRVELGEIESRLREVPGVDEVLVVADRPTGRPPRLLAYWTGVAPRDRLLKAARRWLPPYMVPAAWVPLPHFPLSPNGKIDRKALPAPSTTTADDVARKRPRSDTELRIAAVWSEVLGLTDIPRDQDFFTLGGTSALATEVIARLREATGPSLPLEAIYQAPTIAGLAERVQQNLPSDRPIELALREGPEARPPLHCVMGVHLYYDLALALGHDRTVVGMHVPVRYTPGVDPRPSLTAVARRYLALVRERQPSGPYHLLGLCYGGVVAYEVARLLEQQGERVARVTIIDAILPHAVLVDRRRRLQGYASRVVRRLRSPRTLPRTIGEHGERLMRWGRQRDQPLASTPIDLPIDGPEAEAELQRFARISGRLDAELLVVRATAEPSPAWRMVRRDQGWGGRARRVRVLDVAADHLGVLADPHVRALARVLDRIPG